MKKVIIILGLIITHLGFSQVTDTGDKVGIGTITPTAKLEVKRSGTTLGGKWTPANSIFTITDGSNSLLFDTNEIYGSGVLHFGSKSGDIAVFRSVTETSSSNKMIIKNNGNVGIGTSNPLSKLHISNGASGGTPHSISSVTVEDDENGMISILTPSNKTAFFGFADENDNYVGGMQYEHVNNRMVFRVNNHTNDMTINSEGRVGIGTTTPSEKLEVNGNILLPNTGWLKANTNTGSSKRILGMDVNNDIYIGGVDSGTQHVNIRTNGANRLHISSSGNVGIGTTDTKGFKLGVQGTIAAKEVKVATYANWSDFVFKSNYNLPTLKEVEKHIKDKGHLKDIPSAEEVKENGIFLGEMDAKLLQKIEELTLYTIDQEKRIESLEAKNEKLIALVKKVLETKVEK